MDPAGIELFNFSVSDVMCFSCRRPWLDEDASLYFYSVSQRQIASFFLFFSPLIDWRRSGVSVCLAVVSRSAQLLLWLGVSASVLQQRNTCSLSLLRKNSASPSLLFCAQLMGGDAKGDSDDFLTRMKPSPLHMYNLKKSDKHALWRFKTHREKDK